MARWSIAVGVLAALAAVWFLAFPQSEQPAAEPPTEPAQPEAPVSPATGQAGEPAAPAPAAAAQQQPTAATQPTATPEPSHDTIPNVTPPRAEGDVVEYKARFAREPRDSAAQALESGVQTAFHTPDVPPALFRSVLCRQTVCKIDLRWAPDRAAGYMGAMMRVIGIVGKKIAVQPIGSPNAQGESQLEVYVERGETLNP